MLGETPMLFTTLFKVLFGLLVVYLPPQTHPTEITVVADTMNEKDLQILTRFEALSFFSEEMEEIDLNQLRVQLNCVIQHPDPRNCNVPHMYHPDVVRDARHLTSWFLAVYGRDGRAAFVRLLQELDEEAAAGMERIDLKGQAQARRLKE